MKRIDKHIDGMKSWGAHRSYDERLNQLLGALFAWCAINTIGVVVIAIYLALGN